MFDKILDFLFSMKLMFILMLIFAVAVGYATFLENSHDTDTAKILVYSATWFEMLLFVLTINLIGSMITNNVFKKSKISILLFHISFALILIGAGISRQFGYEGSMIIAEGESTNIMYSKDPYLQVKYGVLSSDGQIQDGYEFTEYMLFSDITQGLNHFDRKLDIPVHKPLRIEYVDYKTDVVYDVLPGNGSGHEYIMLKVPKQNGGGTDTAYLKSGNIRIIGGMLMAFNNDSRTDAVQFSTNDQGEVEFTAPFDATTMDPDNMPIDSATGRPMRVFDSLDRDVKHTLQFRQPYFIQDKSFFYEAHFSDIKLDWIKSKKENEGRNHLFVKLSVGDVSVIKPMRYRHTETTTYYNFVIGDVHVSIGYGPKQIALPFFVKCVDFRMETYTGSNNPSSYESDVAIDDPENETFFEANIFMNNFIDYGGYRFFQSSYQFSNQQAMDAGDPDITVLSVNYDRPGTIVTYIGYLLMALGFIWSLFNSHSRFTMLRKKVKEYQTKKAGMTVLLMLITFGSFASEVSKDDYVEEAKSVLVLEFKGRISPLQTHAKDVLYKLKKKGKHTPVWADESYSSLEVYLSMLANPKMWYDEKVLKTHKAIRVFLDVEDKYISLSTLLDSAEFKKGNIVIREDFANAQRAAHLVKDADKSVRDKEIIKLFDNANLLYWVLLGDRFKAYPVADSSSVEWKSAMEMRTGLVRAKDSAVLSQLNRWVLSTLAEAEKSGDYGEALEALQNLKKYQRSVGEDLPSEGAVEMEILYNDLNIFFMCMIMYSMLALFLLVFLLMDVFNPKNRFINIVLKVLFWMTTTVVAFHVFGLGLRWYVVGHAPWSNGYEALIFIGFATMLAGLIFYKSSRFTIGAAALLASLILGIAHGASTDPELTNLQPVLKSIWLVIHVAVITGSYGFLGLGAVLGLINIVLHIARGTKPKGTVNITINELTATSELTMTIGLYLAAIGTFLGGVWANESWGRYWGWDAKETWALVIVLTYSILLHIRFIPFLKGKLLFNILSVFFFGTVIMTYFGVNFYLTKGLHSYAQGGGEAALPSWAIISIVVLVIMSVYAAIQNKRYRERLKS